MAIQNSLLILDDESASVNTIARLFRKEYEVFKFTHGTEALKFLKNHSVDMLLADQRMPEMTGVEFFVESMKLVPEAIRILITGYSDLEAVVEAINAGQIYYYISKPWEPEMLKRIVANGMENINLKYSNQKLMRELERMNSLLKTENELLKQQAEEDYTFDFIVGTSPRMQQVLKLTRKIIASDLTVLITGETGTGKELLARAIHYNSPRKHKLFVAENCGAMPESLLESRLFGHRKGAFTGAVNNQKGLFELAQGGTVFLDEIGDTTPAFQLRLLRVLQEKEIHPLGSEKNIQIDVRIIAATNKNLKKLVKEGRFREDLFHRLNVIPLHLPPLRERGEDIQLLAKFFIEKYCKILGKKISGLDEEAILRLQQHSFTGNIRELENLIQRAVILTEPGQFITSSLLFWDEESLVIETPETMTMVNSLDIKANVSHLEQRIIRKAIAETGGNLTKAAQRMGLSRMGLYKKLKRYAMNEFLPD